MSTLTGIAPSTTVRVRVRERLVDEPGVRNALTHAGLVAALVVADVARSGPTPALVLLLAVVAFGAWRLPLRWVLAPLVSAWALDTGLVEHSYGRLTFADADLARLLGCAVVALTVALLGARHG